MRIEAINDDMETLAVLDDNDERAALINLFDHGTSFTVDVIPVAGRRSGAIMFSYGQSGVIYTEDDRGRHFMDYVTKPGEQTREYGSPIAVTIGPKL